MEMKSQLLVPGLLLACICLCLLQCVVCDPPIEITKIVSGVRGQFHDVPAAMVGDNVTLRCEVVSNADTPFVWKKSIYVTVTTSDRITIYREPDRGDSSDIKVSVLTIRSLLIADSDRYTCHFGGSAANSDLSVYSPPSCSPSGPQTKQEGDHTVIGCSTRTKLSFGLFGPGLDVIMTSPNMPFDVSSTVETSDLESIEEITSITTWQANRSQDGIIFRCDLADYRNSSVILRSCSLGPFSVLQNFISTTMVSVTDIETTGHEVSTTNPSSTTGEGTDASTPQSASHVTTENTSSATVTNPAESTILTTHIPDPTSDVSSTVPDDATMTGITSERANQTRQVSTLSSDSSSTTFKKVTTVSVTTVHDTVQPSSSITEDPEMTSTLTKKTTDLGKEGSKSSPVITTPSDLVKPSPSVSLFTIFFILFMVSLALAVVFLIITILLCLKVRRMSRYSWSLKTEALMNRDECERQKVELKGVENGAFTEIPLNDVSKNPDI